METSVVTTKGQIVIPAKIRKKYDIKEGTKIHFIENGSKITLEPITENFYRKLQGSLKGSGLLEELMKEKKRAKEIE